MRDPREIIKRPVVTEKTTRLMNEENKYTFVVALDAEKVEIKRAIEELFKVKVLDVTTCRVKGKVRRMGRFVGKRPDWKKAVVTLREGDRIEVFEGA